jgi:hypothetical protein
MLCHASAKAGGRLAHDGFARPWIASSLDERGKRTPAAFTANGRDYRAPTVTRESINHQSRTRGLYESQLRVHVLPTWGVETNPIASEFFVGYRDDMRGSAFGLAWLLLAKSPAAFSWPVVAFHCRGGA